MCDFTFVLVRSPSCFMSYLYFRFPTLQTKVLITICADVNYLYKNRSMTAQIQKSVCVPILPTRDHLLALWCFHSACVKLFVVVHNCNNTGTWTHQQQLRWRYLLMRLFMCFMSALMFRCQAHQEMRILCFVCDVIDGDRLVLTRRSMT